MWNVEQRWCDFGLLHYRCAAVGWQQHNWKLIVLRSCKTDFAVLHIRAAQQTVSLAIRNTLQDDSVNWLKGKGCEFFFWISRRALSPGLLVAGLRTGKAQLIGTACHHWLCAALNRKAWWCLPVITVRFSILLLLLRIQKRINLLRFGITR